MCEQPRLYTEDKVKSRKEHICCECGSEIPKGDEYVRITGIWDEEWSCYKQCLGCHKVCEIMLSEHVDELYLGWLWETISNIFYHYEPEVMEYINTYLENGGKNKDRLLKEFGLVNTDCVRKKVTSSVDEFLYDE